MRKLKEWLSKRIGAEQTLEGEITTTYTPKDEVEAPSGHMPLMGTDVEVVAYPVSDLDLMVLVNKSGVCVFRTILVGALRTELDAMQANVNMTDQRIVLGERSEPMREVVRQMLKRKA